MKKAIIISMSVLLTAGVCACNTASEVIKENTNADNLATEQNTNSDETPVVILIPANKPKHNKNKKIILIVFFTIILYKFLCYFTIKYHTEVGFTSNSQFALPCAEYFFPDSSFE